MFTNLFADIGDEQSIEQSLSTFSGHIKNIVRILRRADQHTLVLFDELGAGTDPQEGAALARAILADMVERLIPCLVATHYPELKIYAHNTAGIINASMEFDVQTLRPTYRLTLGLPGRSNALAIAARLGLEKKIIEDARAEISPEELRADNLLNEIHRQRELARKAREKADRDQSDAEKMKKDLIARLEKIEDERRALLERAREKAEDETAALRLEMDDVRRALARARQPLEALKPLQQHVEEITAVVQQVVERQPGAVESTEKRPLRPGEKVHVRSIRMDGVITAVGESDVEVQIGNLRVRARQADLLRRADVEAIKAEEQKAALAKAPAGKTSFSRSAAASEDQPGSVLPIPRDGDRPARSARGRRVGCAGTLPRVGFPGRAALRAHHPRQGHRPAAPGDPRGAGRLAARQELGERR